MLEKRSVWLIAIGAGIALGTVVFGFSLTQSDRDLLLDNLHSPSERLDSLGSPSRNLDLRLVAISPVEKLLTLEVAVNAPQGQGAIVVPLNFIGSYLHQANVELTERPRKELRAGELPGPGWTQYRGRTQVQFESNFAQFPVDAIDLGVAFDDSRGKNEPAETQTPTLLFVDNHLSDYAVTSLPSDVRGGNTYFFLRLRRNGFLIFLSALLVLIAGVSSIAIVRGIGISAPELSLLTYFVGLWTMRDIVMTPLQDARPFPTLLDLAVLGLFCFTTIGVLLPREKKEVLND